MWNLQQSTTEPLFVFGTPSYDYGELLDMNKHLCFYACVLYKMSLLMYRYMYIYVYFS